MAKKTAGKPQRKTQAQRREETRHKVLISACKLFGRKGYAATSLEDIGADAGVTITPIYHYFGNKQNLLAAATEHMEEKLVVAFTALPQERPADMISAAWRRFVDICQSPGFVQIVLMDAPHFLGRERWQDTAVVKLAEEILTTPTKNGQKGLSERDRELMRRMIIAALSEAALMIGRNPDYDGQEVIDLLVTMVPS